MANRFYITTPLYYVNAPPHLGHAYTEIVSDCLARYHRLNGEEVWFLTGSDEHGQKIARAAESARLTPQAFVDQMIQPFQTLWRTLHVRYDDFIRTTESRHIRSVQAALQRLFDAHQLVKSIYTGWYCVPCETYWTSTDFSAEQLAQSVKTCANCQRPVEALEEEGYDLRLGGEAQQWLLHHLDTHPEFIVPETRRNEVRSLLERPLPEVLCVTRPVRRVGWGIPAPFDAHHVVYVWVDALLNYISAVGFPDDQQRLAHWWPADVHVIGKDILRHHAIYWPMLLHALGLELPHTILAHGWWTVGDVKMSKSRGNVVDPQAVVAEYGVDALRYFVLREVPFGHDGVFTEEALVKRFNADLANDVGNLHFRTLTMVEKYTSGRIPSAHQCERSPADEVLARLRQALPQTLERAMARYDFVAALEAILVAMNRANKFIEEQAPWTVAAASHTARLHGILWQLLETLRVTTLTLWPFIPHAAERMWQALGWAEPLWQATDQRTLAQRIETAMFHDGQRIQKGQPLFPRRELT